MKIPDVEAMRHLACAQLVVGNIGLAYRVPVLAIMGVKKGRQKFLMRGSSHNIYAILFSVRPCQILGLFLSVTAPAFPMHASALSFCAMRRRMIWRLIILSLG